MGRPIVGPEAVGAARDLSEVRGLVELDPSWRPSTFVRLGNPHCITFLRDPSRLPTMAKLRMLNAPLSRIAFAPPAGVGSPCARGVNLQWAALAGPNLMSARIFERGEGPTRSSGTSACAVATAAHHLGLVDGPIVRVRMPGGTAQVALELAAGRLAGIRYRGVARRITQA
jgi:diaminopimelate epimerase